MPAAFYKDGCLEFGAIAETAGNQYHVIIAFYRGTAQMSPVACLLVLIGGFVGGIARLYLSTLVGRRFDEYFPWGTFVVNVSGALIIGIVAGLGRNSSGFFAAPLFRDFVVVGLLGGYTTVSSFCLQSLYLAFSGEMRRAAFNVVGSSLLCLFAVALGFRLVEWSGSLLG